MTDAANILYLPPGQGVHAPAAPGEKDPGRQVPSQLASAEPALPKRPAGQFPLHLMDVDPPWPYLPAAQAAVQSEVAEPLTPYRPVGHGPLQLLSGEPPRPYRPAGHHLQARTPCSDVALAPTHLPTGQFRQ